MITHLTCKWADGDESPQACISGLEFFLCNHAPFWNPVRGPALFGFPPKEQQTKKNIDAETRCTMETDPDVSAASSFW